jgi:phosphate/sulfate permease
VQYRTIKRILIARVFTLPVTIFVAASLYYLLANPKF